MPSELTPGTSTAGGDGDTSCAETCVPLADAGLDGFVRDLFGRVPHEDLAPYEASDLMRLADAALRHLEEPTDPSAPPMPRLFDVTVGREGHAREITVVEAVNQDRPFLLDSTLAAIGAHGLTPLLVAHPIFGTERHASGGLSHVVGEAAAAGLGARTRESLIHVHVDRVDDPRRRERLAAALEAAFRDVAVATRDHAAMRARLAELADTCRTSPGGGDPEEAAAFLTWLGQGHFTLLGIRTRRQDGPGTTAAEPDLGIVPPPDRDGEMPPSGRGGVTIGKASGKSRVHRTVHLDRVTVAGRLAGSASESVDVFGLFTASAYAGSVRDIPHLRRKVATVLAMAGLDPDTHAGRGLLAVLEGYPRDDLFQIDVDRLHRFALVIAELANRPRVRVLARSDRSGRFVSVLVYMFKDRYTSDVRARVGDLLAVEYGGRVSAFYPDLPDGPLARIHFVIGLDRADPPECDVAALEAAVALISRTWVDELRGTLAASMDARRAGVLADRWPEAFSAAYRERYDTRLALEDIEILEALSDARPRAVDVGRRDADPESRIRLQVFSRGAPLPLSTRVPALAHLGFRVIDERTYDVRPSDGDEGTRTWMHDMLLERAAGGVIDLDLVGEPLKAALAALSDGVTESDPFNVLVLEAGLTWDQAAILRALGRYLRQLRVRYGQDYLAATLAAHPLIARDIVALFGARFDPRVESDGMARVAALRAAVEASISAVTSLDEDRILRRFVNLVDAAVRTDAFQTAAQGRPAGVFTFKFACARVDGMPLPRPLFEIFVYSPRVEGSHLRFGLVARGGLRWSDRPEDFRTEVLGLVKAQQVKNAVIVPVGAKGAFVPKRLPPPSERAARLTEGQDSYRVFVDALLRVTDDIVDGHVVPPPGTVRQDADDPYLVVAADKGTATFSDIANAISLSRGHWLGDAFASGGSQGYDHKAMGITARGAWEAIKRHFGGMGVDPERDAVTVAGVGDMSGDVFGNGMLLSRSLRLVAAFDHRHVFIDPDPDPDASFAERRRLFSLPRSSWADYDEALISVGGGVYTRSSKTIPLSAAARGVLGTDATEATPAELIQVILRAPVDLLWFGGIGTYVRSGEETDDAAGDRANDATRVTGAALRAKVVGEGANLGLTQRGRVEAARAGVRLNTDAIDNSAGVNTSDLEVNVKIALMGPVRDGRLDIGARNGLLASMTGDVAGLVLRNNALQALALSLCMRNGAREAASAVVTIRALESEGRLDRGIEELPDDAQIADRVRRDQGLTRPEYAVLLAYAKLALKDGLLTGAVPDDPYFDRDLEAYFPTALRRRFPGEIARHRLRREIVATVLSNAIVNRGGPSLVTRLTERTGAAPAIIAKAYAISRDALGLAEMDAAIDALPGGMRAGAQLDLHAEVQDVLGRSMAWFACNVDLDGAVDPLVEPYRKGVDALMSRATAAPDGSGSREAELARIGLDPGAARRLARLTTPEPILDIVHVGRTCGRAVADVAEAYHAVDRAIGVSGLVLACRSLPTTDAFDGKLVDRAIGGIAGAHRSATAEIVKAGGDAGDAVTAWCSGRESALSRFRSSTEAMIGSGVTLSKAVLSSEALIDLARRRPDAP